VPVEWLPARRFAHDRPWTPRGEYRNTCPRFGKHGIGNLLPGDGYPVSDFAEMR